MDLKSTTARMEKVEMKHEDANKKATAERTHMARELKSAKKQLKKAMYEMRTVIKFALLCANWQILEFSIDAFNVKRELS